MHRTPAGGGSAEQMTVRLSLPSHNVMGSDTSACLRLETPRPHSRTAVGNLRRIADSWSWWIRFVATEPSSTPEPSAIIMDQMPNKMLELINNGL